MIKISVIVPVYNVEKYIEQCINSILDQEYQNIEILLINDGSTDKSQEICDRFAKANSCIKLINKANGGLSDTRNVGISNSTGDYIVFVDSDDFWMEGVINSLVKEISTANYPDLIFFRYSKFYQYSGRVVEKTSNINKIEVAGKSGVQALKYILEIEKDFSWIVVQGIYKREFIIEKNINFIKGRNYEDALWLPEVFIKAKSVDYFDQVVYVYRLEREGQITSTVSKKNLLDNIYVSKYWNNKLILEELKNDLKESILRNISGRYFYAIWFSAFIAPKERDTVIEQLIENKEIMKYTNNTIQRVTALLCNLIGYKLTTSLCKKAITVKRWMNN